LEQQILIKIIRVAAYVVCAAYALLVGGWAQGISTSTTSTGMKNFEIITSPAMLIALACSIAVLIYVKAK
jgi:hypothetical protein